MKYEPGDERQHNDRPGLYKFTAIIFLLAYFNGDRFLAVARKQERIINHVLK
jgi:hypothetical protein